MTIATNIDALRTNPEQWRAFEEEDHCAVLAPPGSGKTSLLTTKVGYALHAGIIRPPRGAACITYTVEAAAELRRRLDAMGIRRNPNVFVGTVHSFALHRVVRPFAAAAGRPGLAASTFATAAQVDAAFDAALNAVGIADEDRRNVRSTVEVARRRLDLNGRPSLGGPSIAAVGRALQHALEAALVYDYDDLVRHAVALVEDNPWVRRILASTFQLICVDEYQDLPPGLDRIVRAVTVDSDGDSKLFAVGDVDQSIYGFNGAHPKLLRDLAARSSVVEVRLQRNYRSGQNIIDIALQALGEDRSVVGREVGGVVTREFAPGGPDAQAKRVEELVRQAIADAVPAHEIAILTPTRAERDLCAHVLRQAGLPVFARDDEHWSPVPSTTLLEISAAWCSNGRPRAQLASLLTRFSGSGRSVDRHERRRATVRVLLGTEPEDDACSFVEALVRAALLDHAEGRAGTDDGEQLSKMRRALGPSGPLCLLSVAALGQRARSPGNVLALTIHAAKGLEFDRVIIAGMDDRGIPGPFAATKEDFVEARRRLYVAITRARHSVTLVHTDYRVSARGRLYPVPPSRFLRDLDC